MLIKEMHYEDRPREKLEKYGKRYMSTSELIAIIIRVGTKEKNVLELAKDVLNKIERIDVFKEITLHELMKIRGVGKVKALEILAAIELGYRIYESKGLNKVERVTDPKSVYHYIKDEIYGLKQEHFIVIFLNVKNEIIMHKTLFVGTLNQTIIHPREIFKYAVKCSAASIILVHNHPSGNTNPSKDDIVMTKKIDELGRMMDIKVVDHIVVSDISYTSMKVEGHF